jgi:hypothetical protein
MTNNVLKIDWRAIDRDAKLESYRRLQKLQKDLVSSDRLLALADKVRPLIDRMCAIDKLEGLLLIEQILKPHRSLNNDA